MVHNFESNITKIWKEIEDRLNRRYQQAGK